MLVKVQEGALNSGVEVGPAQYHFPIRERLGSTLRVAQPSRDV